VVTPPLSPPQDDCKPAWLTKAEALHCLGRHEEVARDMQALKAAFAGNDAQIDHALQRAQFEVRGSGGGGGWWVGG
jgi:hypothetical protein